MPLSSAIVRTLSSPARRSSSSAASTPEKRSRRKRADHIEPQPGGRSGKQRVLSSATRVFILDDKLTPTELDGLRALVVDLGGMNTTMSFANVILTAARAPRRIQRYLDDEVMLHKKPILHTTWLIDSAKERLLQGFGPYRIMGGDETNDEILDAEWVAPVKPTPDPVTPKKRGKRKAVSEPSSETDPGSQTASPASVANESRTESEVEAAPSSPPNMLSLSQQEQQSLSGPSWQNAEYACLRPSPLKSEHNQALIDELEVLRLQRVLAGKQDINATAYARAISAIKAYPHSLAPSPANAKNIKGVGPKIAKLIVQFYSEGCIAEAESIRNDASFAIMTSFVQLYGVGPKRAREYYSAGARTLDDVIRMGGSLGVHLHVEECLRILPDITSKIPRAEVREVAQVVSDEVDRIMAGCTSVITGGFRRGKPKSGDVDVIISLPKPPTEEDGATPLETRGLWNSTAQLTLMDDLLRSLKRQGLVTHVVNVSTPSNTFVDTFSRLDVAEVVMKINPSDAVPMPRYRRVDIVLGPYETHGAAVLGWTGSTQFERDLRLLAKRKGFTFHSTGLVPEGTKRPLSTPTEQHVFDALDLPYMPPHLRNCDA